MHILLGGICSHPDACSRVYPTRSWRAGRAARRQLCVCVSPSERLSGSGRLGCAWQPRGRGGRGGTTVARKTCNDMSAEPPAAMALQAVMLPHQRQHRPQNPCIRLRPRRPPLRCSAGPDTQPAPTLIRATATCASHHSRSRGSWVMPMPGCSAVRHCRPHTCSSVLYLYGSSG